MRPNCRSTATGTRCTSTGNGDRTASHPASDTVAFTGSTEAGRLVGRNAVDHFAFPALELGGNNPHVVLADADLEDAIDAAIFGSFWHQGQVCISINRHLVHDSRDDEAVALANDTEYGLAGSVHSADRGRARDVADRIDVGMIHVNDQPVTVDPHAPFGGTKASGVGRYNGDWIIDELTEVTWTSVQREPRGYPF